VRKLSTDLIKSGSFQGTFTGSFTGSITGNANTSNTASYALISNLSNTSVTASYALISNLSNTSNTASISNLSLTSISSSFALSSSYAENAAVRIVTGSGVLVTNTFDDVSSKNVYNNIITTFKSQENESLSRYNLIDGFIDDFTDSTGIFESSSFFFRPSGSYGSKGYFTNELPLGDFYYNDNLLLMHFSGSNDSTSSFDSGRLNTTVGWFGDAKITSSEYKFDSSLFVGGTGYITASNLSLGTDYTIEFWAKSTVSSYLYTKVLFNLGNAGTFSQVTANTVSWNLVPSTITVPNINNWNHYAFTRKNNIANIFLNGVLQTSSSNSSSVSNSTLYVGRGISPSTLTYWNGFYDEFRITANTARYNGPSFATQSIEFYNNLGSDPTGSAYSSSLILNYQSCSTNIQNVNVVVLAEPLSSSFSLNNNFNLYVSKDSGSTYYGSPLVYGSVYSSSILIYTSTLDLSSYGTDSVLALGISSSVSPLRIYGVGVVSTTSNKNNILATSGLVGINYSSLSGNGLSSSYNVSDSSFNSSNTIVFLTGSVLSPVTDFSLSDGNLVLSNPVPNNQKVSLLKFTSLLSESNPNTSVIDSQNFTSNLSQSVFSLSQTVSIPSNLLVYSNGLLNDLNADYYISASKYLVFNTPKNSQDKISIRYINTIGNANIEMQRYIANGVSSSYSLSSSLNNVNGVLVSINGILQTPSLHYYINSSSLYDAVVLDESPKSGSVIELRRIQYASPYSTLSSSFAISASYASNANLTLTASNLIQTVISNFNQNQESIITGLPLDGNNWSANIIEEWDSGSFVLDSNYGNVSLLLHFSGSNRSSRFIDNSLNNYTASISGSPVISTNESKFNNSSLFLSNNSFLYYSQSLLPLSSDFTVESWVQPISYVNQPAIWSQGNGYPFGANRLQLYLNTSGNVIVQYGMSNIITSSLLVPLSKWTNITFVKSSNIQYLFIDGTLTNTSSISTLETAAFIIGNNYSLGSQYFNGYIDEFRITNSARYSSSFTVSDVEFSNANTVSQSATKYFASIGGLNDSYADYGVEKLSNTSIKIKKLSKTTQPISASGYLNPTVDRVYVNVVDNTKALVQTLTAVYASTANSASYAVNAKSSESSSYLSASIINAFGLIRLTGSLQISGSTSGVYIFTQSVASSTWNVTHSLNSRFPVIQIYSASYESVPSSNYTITSIDDNKTRLNFTYPISGSATVIASPVSVVSTTLRSTTIFSPNNIVFGI
jgi:hypothetical protein